MEKDFITDEELNNKVNDIKKYNQLCKFYSTHDNVFKEIPDNDKHTMAQHIHDHHKKMSAIEKRNLFSKLVTEEKISNVLLRYELMNLDLGAKITQKDEFIKFMKKYFFRYH